MSYLIVLFIIIILTSILVHFYHDKEQYFDFNYNSDRAIPIADGEFNLNANMYLTENNDEWFSTILKPLLIQPSIPTGVPLEVRSRNFAEKMGGIVGKYLIDKFNDRLGSDESVGQTSSESAIKYVITSFDVTEVVYYYQTSEFSDVYTKYYTDTSGVGDETNQSDEVCEIWGKYLISRDTKAWGVLIDMKTRHHQRDLTPEITDFTIVGKVFQDKLAGVSRNIAPYMASYSPLI